MPNFFVIGAAKCGTTALYHYLKQHPAIYMSPNKEPRFFAMAEGDEDFASREPGAVTNLEDYERLFDGVTSETAVGEASALYLYRPLVIERVRHFVPDARLIALLRNPVERAFSAFVHATAIGWESHRDFEHALQREQQRIPDACALFHYKSMGFYYEQLKQYLDAFGESQIRIYLYEDFRENPLLVCQDIFRFLDVDDTFAPDVSTRHNVYRVPKTGMLRLLLSQRRRSALKRFLPRSLRAPLAGALLARPQFPAHVREQLVEEYRDDVLRLQRLIGRDLSSWLQLPLEPASRRELRVAA